MVKAAAVPDYEKDSRDIRRKRLSAGIRSFFAVVFALAALGAAAMLADLISYRRALTASAAGLSPRTDDLLNNVSGGLEITAIFSDDGSDDEDGGPEFSFADAKRLVSSIGAEKRANLRAEFIHIGADPAGAADALRKFPGAAPNSIVVACGGNVRVLDKLDLAESSVGGESAGFALPGEAALYRAVERVVNPKPAAAYFISGHGEYSPDDGNPVTGASSFGRMLENTGFTVSGFSFAGADSLPKDCRLLVIAGPRLMFSPLEVEIVSRYLDDGGRALILLDNARNVSLSPLLEHWNVKVEDFKQDFRSAKLTTSSYDDFHRITTNMCGIVSTWTAPCSVSGASSERENAASLSVSELVYVNAPDRTSVAVAVSRRGSGAAKSRSTRIVVCGDADILSNAVYNMKPEGNAVFLSRVVDWLTTSDQSSK